MRHYGYFVLAGVVLAICLCTQTGRSQDDWDQATKPAEQPRADQARANQAIAIQARVVQARALALVRAPQALIVNNVPHIELPDFDRWVLVGKKLDQIEQDLRSQFALHVNSADHACALSADQRERLRLAGDGDAKQVIYMIDQAQSEYREIGNDQEKYMAFVRQVSTLRLRILGDSFDESSLYQKILYQTLNDEQMVRYAQQEFERRKFHYQAKIELVVSNCETVVAFRGDQRQRLIQLLIDETEPPKKFGRYDYYVVLFQMARLKDEKLEAILDDVQMRSFRKVSNQSPAMEQVLRTQGYLP